MIPHIEMLLESISCTGLTIDSERCEALCHRAAERLQPAPGGLMVHTAQAALVALQRCTDDVAVCDQVVHQIITQERIDLRNRREMLRRFVFRLQGVCGFVLLVLVLRTVTDWFSGDSSALM